MQQIAYFSLDKLKKFAQWLAKDSTQKVIEAIQAEPGSNNSKAISDYKILY